MRLGAKSGKLALGQTYQLKPKISGTGGVTWTSSDEDVAVVDRDGVISAVSVGKCVITCTTYNGKTAECSVTVVMPAPAKVELNAYKTQVYDGETFLLEATLNGGYRETVSFTSSDGNVARVDESGVVTAVKPGTAVIRAQASGGNYTNCVVEVLPGSTSIETDGAITLYAGGTMAVPRAVRGRQREIHRGEHESGRGAGVGRRVRHGASRGRGRSVRHYAQRRIRLLSRHRAGAARGASADSRPCRNRRRASRRACM